MIAIATVEKGCTDYSAWHLDAVGAGRGEGGEGWRGRGRRKREVRVWDEKVRKRKRKRETDRHTGRQVQKRGRENIRESGGKK